MIIGIGNDLINIERIEKTLSKFGNRFVNRVFTDIEIKKDGKLHKFKNFEDRGNYFNYLIKKIKFIRKINAWFK